MRRNNQIRTYAREFLTNNYTEEENSSVHFLEIFEKYRNIMLEKFSGFGLEAKDFENEVLIMFPSVTLDSNHNFIGLGKHQSDWVI